MFRNSFSARSDEIINHAYLLMIFSICLFLLLMMVNSAKGDISIDDSGLDQKSGIVSNSSTTPFNASINNLGGSNDIESQSGNSSSGGTYNVHIYVSNMDDDGLDASLFIDSKLMETKLVSSDSEVEYGSYPLTEGTHNFKITWWDEDVKQSLETEESKDIREETSVNLYTTLNDEPEEFDLSVKLTNENDRDLDAYLYVDDNFEKNKEVNKESTSDFGTISLEEGVHNLSVRWRDKDTKIEYEKNKKVTVSKDDVVVFYVPPGISFDVVETTRSTEKYSDQSYGGRGGTSNADENADGESDDAASTIKKSSSDNSAIEENESRAYRTSEISNASAELSSDENDPSTSDLKTHAESFSSNLYPHESESSKSRRTSALSSPVIDDNNSLYIYAGLSLLAAYLLFRH